MEPTEEIEDEAQVITESKNKLEDIVWSDDKFPKN